MKFFCAAWTKPIEFHRATFQNEPFRQRPPQASRFEVILSQIDHHAALRTNEMMMVFRIRVNPKRSVHRTHLAQQASVQENFQILVHRPQRNRRDLLPYLLVDGLGRRMAAHFVNCTKNDFALVRQGQANCPATITKFLHGQSVGVPVWVLH